MSLNGQQYKNGEPFAKRLATDINSVSSNSNNLIKTINSIPELESSSEIINSDNKQNTPTSLNDDEIDKNLKIQSAVDENRATKSIEQSDPTVNISKTNDLETNGTTNDETTQPETMIDETKYDLITKDEVNSLENHISPHKIDLNLNKFNHMNHFDNEATHTTPPDTMTDITTSLKSDESCSSDDNSPIASAEPAYKRARLSNS